MACPLKEHHPFALRRHGYPLPPGKLEYAIDRLRLLTGELLRRCRLSVRVQALKFCQSVESRGDARPAQDARSRRRERWSP